MKQLSKKIFTMLLVLATIFAAPAFALTPIEEYGDQVVQPMASMYLSSYGASCTSSGSTVYVDFNVMATGIMNYVGSTGIYLYESSNGSAFQCVRIFYPSGNSQMLKSNSQFNAASVTYSGTRGSYYYAVVNFYAENSNGSDTRAYTTSTMRLS